MVGGTIDGRYHVLRVIGEGGMGAVYEAHHFETGRRVALKLIRAQVRDQTEVVRRFQREARAAGTLDTPHVVDVFDAGTDAATGVIYMAMELLQGEDLQQILKRCQRLRPELCVRLVAQACLGLGKAHAAGVVHRDIKPANLFLSRLATGEIIVKVVDFGIAKTLGPARTDETSLTRTGGLLGSPHYMAPEQTRGSKHVDHRADIWSIGVVLYQAIAGRVPHVRSESNLELLMRIATRPAPRLQQLAPWVPPGVALVVHRMLAIDPAARFQSAAEVVEALQPWMPNGTRVDAEELVQLPEAEAAAMSAGDDDATVREGPDALARLAQELAPPSPARAVELAGATPEPATLRREEGPPPSQNATTLVMPPRRRPRLGPAVAIAIAFAVGVAGEIVYQIVRRSTAPPPAQEAPRRR